jgi:hypothetical protein
VQELLFSISRVYLSPSPPLPCPFRSLPDHIRKAPLPPGVRIQKPGPLPTHAMKSPSVPGEPHHQSPTATNRHQSSLNLPSQLVAVKAPSPFPVGLLKLGIRAYGTPDCITSLSHIAFPRRASRNGTRRDGLQMTLERGRSSIPREKHAR